MARHPTITAALALGALAGLAGLSGCDTVAHRNQAVLAGTLAAQAVVPNFDLEQIYYLGSFDPSGQLPPTLYRIRVRGQAAFLSRTRFASSWVPAEVIDGLGASVELDNGNGQVRIQRESTGVALDGGGRRLVQFGPEGFRTAPKNHRLVVLMGSSPEAMEQAFASALGTVASARTAGNGQAVDKDALATLLEAARQRSRLQALMEPLP